MANGSPIEQARGHLQSARDAAQSQIEQLQEEVAQLDAALAALPGGAPAAPAAVEKPKPANGRRRRRRKAAAPEAEAAAPAAAAAEEKAAPTNGRRRRATQSRPGTISAAVENFLDEHHPRALHASEVLEHLQSSGSTPGGNAKNVLQSTLNRLQERGTVKNIGKNRWRRVRPRGRQPGGQGEAAGESSE